AGEIVVVIPARRMEHGALEAIQSGQARDRRVGEGPDRGDEDLRAEIAAGGPDLPALGLIVPVRLEHLVAIAQVRGDAVAAGDIVNVGMDLRLLGESAWPRRV